jgi:hypothetical protein
MAAIWALNAKRPFGGQTAVLIEGSRIVWARRSALVSRWGFQFGAVV